MPYYKRNIKWEAKVIAYTEDVIETEHITKALDKNKHKTKSLPNWNDNVEITNEKIVFMEAGPITKEEYDKKKESND